MRKIFFYLALCMGTAVLTTACSSDDTPESKVSDVTLNYTLPDDIADVTAINLKAVFTNVSTGQSETFTITEQQAPVSVTKGLYDIDINGTVSYKDGVAEKVATLRSSQKGVNITSDKYEATLETYVVSVGGGFVLSELFFAGTLKPDGDRYQEDAYFRITNNSDVTLYADGLFIAETEFQIDMQEYDTATPDIRKEATAVDYLAVLPGSGTDHPVAPGQSILVAVNAVNHQTADLNPNSFDLSKADFEIYNESSMPDYYVDVDNPDVPNTTDIFTTSATVWTPHVRGVKSYMIGRLGTTPEQWLQNYTYHYEYLFVFGEWSFDMDGDAMKVDNAWIIDAVNIAPKDEFTWHIIDPSLDAGYAWYSEVEYDENRLGKAVRRKFDATTGKLVDTNNSTDDFDSAVTANPFYVFQ